MTFLPPRIKRADTPQNRFLAYVENMDDCWLWDGQINDRGYGVFCTGGRKVSAHRAAYQLFRGPIEGGLHVLHACDVRNCVNPAHLGLGTHADNMWDMARKGRRRGPVGETTPWAVLDAAKVRAIRESEESGRALAKRFGVSPSAIYALRRGKTWKSVK